MAGQLAGHRLGRVGVELLDADEGDPGHALLLAGLEEVEVDLARAQHQPLGGPGLG